MMETEKRYFLNFSREEEPIELNQEEYDNFISKITGYYNPSAKEKAEIVEIRERLSKIEISYPDPNNRNRFILKTRD